MLSDVQTRWASDALWTSNGRLYNVRLSMSVHRKSGTSGGRPSSVHYGRPFDTPIGRPTDVHLRPFQWRHVCKYICSKISWFIYFEVLCKKNFKYFSLSLKMPLLKRCQRILEEVGKWTNQIFDSFLIWTSQFPVSFTPFIETIPKLRMFLTDTILQMQVEGRVWCVPLLCQVRS